MALPPAPMPPQPPPFAPGGGFGHPHGAIHVDEWPAGAAAIPIHDDHMRGSPPPMVEFQDDEYDDKPKKNKNKNKGSNPILNGPVETQLKGYTLEKAEPRLGEKYSWARVGKRALPFDDAKLQAIVRAHRLKTRSGPASDFSRLTSNQQGIIDRLIAEHKLKEKNSNADWILSDVQRFGTWHWTSLEVKKIQVILKRQDKYQTRPGDRTTGHNSSSYTFGELIDLAEPLLPPKKEKKNNAKKQHHDEDLQLLDVPLGPGLPALDNDFGHADHRQVPYQPPMQPPQQPYADPLQQYAPPGAIPIPPHQQIPQYQGQPNPFMPEPHVMMPGQFDAPLEHHHRPAMRARRSPSPRRRRSSSARRVRKLEAEVEDIRNKIDDWRVNDDSSEEQYDRDSVFSPPPSGGSFTPPSTPPRSEAFGPRGSLHRSKSRHAERRYKDEGRERRYRDDRVEIQPASSFRPRREIEGRYREERRPEPRYEHAPRLHRAQTYDDYPTGRAAEPRYVPRAPLQRRLTDYEEAPEYANFGEQYRRRREAARRVSVFDPVQDAYEAGRRERGFEEARAERRRSVMGGLDAYYR